MTDDINTADSASPHEKCDIFVSVKLMNRKTLKQEEWDLEGSDPCGMLQSLYEVLRDGNLFDDDDDLSIGFLSAEARYILNKAGVCY